MNRPPLKVPMVHRMRMQELGRRRAELRQTIRGARKAWTQARKVMRDARAELRALPKVRELARDLGLSMGQANYLAGTYRTAARRANADSKPAGAK